MKDNTIRAALVLCALALAIATISALRGENISTELQFDRTVSCPRLMAQAGAPRAPGAPQDSGSLAAAAAAVAEYEDRHCAQSGYGPVPPVYTGRR